MRDFIRQRERQITTIIIWVVYILLVIAILGSLLQVYADFTGLWPAASGYQGSQNAAQLSQTVEAARAASSAYLAQAQATIQEQLAQRMPYAAVITFLLTLVATVSTYFVWRNAGVEARLALNAMNTEKVKRRSRVEQLVDDLDAEELVELRSRLSGDEDSEAKSLYELLAEEQNHNQA